EEHSYTNSPIQTKKSNNNNNNNNNSGNNKKEEGDNEEEEDDEEEINHKNGWKKWNSSIFDEREEEFNNENEDETLPLSPLPLEYQKSDPMEIPKPRGILRSRPSEDELVAREAERSTPGSDTRISFQSRQYRGPSGS